MRGQRIPACISKYDKSLSKKALRNYSQAANISLLFFLPQTFQCAKAHWYISRIELKSGSDIQIKCLIPSFLLLKD